MQDKGTSAPDHVTYSCIWPEDPVKRAHCSAVILYVFFAILAKSQFFISINNHIKVTCICPQFDWAVYLGMLYPEIELVLPSYICVLWKTLICGEPDRVKIGIKPPFPPLRPEKSRETLSQISEMPTDIYNSFLSWDLRVYCVIGH